MLINDGILVNYLQKEKDLIKRMNNKEKKDPNYCITFACRSGPASVDRNYIYFKTKLRILLYHTFDVNLTRNHPSLLINDCILVNYLQKEKDSIKWMNSGHYTVVIQS